MDVEHFWDEDFSVLVAHKSFFRTECCLEMGIPGRLFSKRAWLLSERFPDIGPLSTKWLSVLYVLREITKKGYTRSFSLKNGYTIV